MRGCDYMFHEYLWRLWILLLWRYWRPVWTRSCAACCRRPCFSRGVGLDDPQRSLPTPTTLWFCDSVKFGGHFGANHRNFWPSLIEQTAKNWISVDICSVPPYTPLLANGDTRTSAVLEIHFLFSTLTHKWSEASPEICQMNWFNVCRI